MIPVKTAREADKGRLYARHCGFINIHWLLMFEDFVVVSIHKIKKKCSLWYNVIYCITNCIINIIGHTYHWNCFRDLGKFKFIKVAVNLPKKGFAPPGKQLFIGPHPSTPKKICGSANRSIFTVSPALSCSFSNITLKSEQLPYYLWWHKLTNECK